MQGSIPRGKGNLRFFCSLNGADEGAPRSDATRVLSSNAVQRSPPAPCWASMRRRYGFKPVHPTQRSSCLEVASAQCIAYPIKPRGISNREIGRPGGVVFDKLNSNFSNELPFVNVLCLPSLSHFRRSMKVSSHRVGSGLYAVTSTAGLSKPFGMPQTT